MAGDNFDKGWVYVLHFDLPGKKSNFYKIGLTKNPIPLRIAQLQTGNPFKISEAHSFESECIGLLEGHLHKIFVNKRYHGEWFELTPANFRTVKKEGKSFNDKFSPLAVQLRALDKKESIHKEMPPTANHLKLHKRALEIAEQINELELRRDISATHLRRLAGNTLGIDGICEFYSLDIPKPSIKGSDLQKHDLNEWEKWKKSKWECDVAIKGKPTKNKSHPKLKKELDDLLNKVKPVFDINTHSNMSKKRAKSSREYHQKVIDYNQQLGMLKVEMDLIIIQFKLDCKRRRGIEGVFKYVRGEKEAFDKKSFEENKPRKAYDSRWYYSSDPVPKFRVHKAIGY